MFRLMNAFYLVLAQSAAISPSPSDQRESEGETESILSNSTVMQLVNLQLLMQYPYVLLFIDHLPTVQTALICAN